MNDPEQDFCPEWPSAFDDLGRPIKISHPVYESDFEFDAIAADRERQEKMVAFLQWLAHDGDIQRAGERALLLAHMCGKTAFRTDAELARKLNMTPGRISQLRREIQGFLPGVNGNRRQKIKARRTVDGTKKLL